MKKILKSIFTIALVASVIVGASQALFSDTEENGSYSFSSGTIDIAVDGENPWTEEISYSLDDMKPSYTGYIDFWIENVGTNPANVWKTITDVLTYDVEMSEPECAAEEGVWIDDSEGYCVGNTPNHNIDSQIRYDMRVELYPPAAQEPVWWETIYMDEDNVRLSDISGTGVYLGMIPVGWSMKVIQSYHMDTDAGNEYQGDGMSFDIQLYAEQLTNEVRLVNKYLSNTDVSHHVWNDKYADFKYKVMDEELNWSLDTVSVPDGDYTLLVWDDSDTSVDSTKYNWDWNAERSEAVVLAHLTDTGDQTHEGSYDPSSDIKDAKVWLVPGTWGTEGGSAGAFGWNASGTFFETGLIDYYDSL